MKYLSLLTLLLPLTACAGTPELSRVDNYLLAEVPPQRMQAVNAARQDQDAADDSLARAQRATQRAKQAVDLSRLDLASERARLDASKLALAVAEADGTVQELARAKAVHGHALAGADVGRQRLALRKREHEFAKLEERLALERARLSDARVELSKALAVQGVNRVEALRVPVQDYHKQVDYHAEEVEHAKVRTAAARVELEEARYELARLEETAAALDPDARGGVDA